MIVLDTNVISALMRRETDQAISVWLDSQPRESIWTTSITVFEIRLGLESMVLGRRRKKLEDEFAEVINEDLDRRVLTFDTMAAEVAGSIAAKQRRAGRPAEIRDVQIAGIAAARKATLATRNTKHFHDVGVTLVNPWSA